MSHTLYNFFADSPLFRAGSPRECVESLNDEQLDLALRAYRKHVDSDWQDLAVEIEEGDGLRTSFDGFDGQLPSDQAIRRAALYFDTVFLADPLYGHTRPIEQYQQASEQMHGFEPTTGPDREAVVDAVAFLARVRPLVAAGVAKVVPQSRLCERDGVSLLHSECNYYDLVPSELLRIFRSWTESSALRSTEDGWISGPEIPWAPCRAIQVGFRDHHQAMVFTLLAQEVLAFDEERSVATMRQWIPKEPPTQDQFDTWADGCRNRLAWVGMNDIAASIAVAQASRSFINTGSRLVHDILGYSNTTGDSPTQRTASLAMQLSLPQLDGLSFEQVALLRESYGESFETYRRAITRGLRSVASRDEIGRRQGLRELEHELRECQIPEVEEEIRRLRRSILRDSAIGLLGLGMAIPTGGLTGAATLMAAANITSKIMGHKDALSKLPAHFLWLANRR